MPNICFSPEIRSPCTLIIIFKLINNYNIHVLLKHFQLLLKKKNIVWSRYACYKKPNLAELILAFRINSRFISINSKILNGQTELCNYQYHRSYGSAEHFQTTLKNSEENLSQTFQFLECWKHFQRYFKHWNINLMFSC